MITSAYVSHLTRLIFTRAGYIERHASPWMDIAYCGILEESMMAHMIPNHLIIVFHLARREVRQVPSSLGCRLVP